MAKDRRAGGLFVDMGLNLAKLNTDVRQGTSTLRKLEGDIKGIGRSIQTAFGAAIFIGGVSAIKSLNDSLVALAEKGEAAGSIAEGFDKLGGSIDVIDRARVATIGLVDAFDLMEVANKGLVANVAGFGENFDKISDLGARLANTLNTDTKGAIAAVTDALVTGKAKGLNALGWTIDASAAYKKFADANDLLANKLSDSQKKMAIQEEAMRQLESVSSRLAPVTDSVANAHSAMANALDGGIKKAAIAINNNEDLIKGYRDLEKGLDNVDWERLGKNAAQFFAILANGANTILPALISGIEKVAGGFNILFGKGLEAEQSRLALKMGELIDAKAQLEKPPIDTTSDPLTSFANYLSKPMLDLQARIDTGNKEAEAIDKEIAKLQSKYDIITRQLDETKKPLVLPKPESTGTGTGKPPGTEPGEDMLEELRKQRAKFAQEQSKALAQFSKDIAATEHESIQKQIDDLFNSSSGGFDPLAPKVYPEVDLVALEKLADQIAEATAKGVKEGYAEEVEKGYITQAKVDELAAVKSQAVKDELMKRGIDANAAATEDRLSTAYGNAVSFWSETWRAAMSGDVGVFEQLLDGIVDSFVSNLLAGLAGGLGEGIGSIADLGKVIGEQAAASFFQPTYYGPGGAPGTQGDQPGAAAPEESNLGYVVGGLNVIGSLIDANKKDAANNDNSGTGAAAGSTAGLAIGAIWGPMGAAIGSAVGAQAGELIGGFFGRGSQNKDTQARHEFAGIFEDALAELKDVAFFNEDGRLANARGDKLNFLEGDPKQFSKPGWGDQFNAAPNSSAFSGVANALEEIKGLNENVGSQGAVTLWENMGKSIDNLRFAVKYLKLDFEDAEAAILQTGLSGEASWHEVETQLQGLGDAFKPGLAAAGAFGDAFDAIIDSGGRGSDAIYALQAEAVEAMEAGITTLDQLQAKLIADGKNPEFVHAMFAGLAEFGIKDLKQLSEATDRELGGIIAAMESNSSLLAEQWAKVTAEIETTIQSLQELQDGVEAEIKLHVTTDYDEKTQQLMDSGAVSGANLNLPPVTTHANGGIFTRMAAFQHAGGLGIMGERGPEAVMPLTDINGKLGVAVRMHDKPTGAGVGNTIVIQVNAQGSAPGVEADIIAAIENIRGEILSDTVNVITDRAQRGYLRGM